jgi:hypothetical protein
MSNVVIVMFGHRSLSGKDTAAEYMSKDGFIRRAFADKLKSTVADLYSFSHEQMHGSLKDVEDARYPNNIDSKTCHIISGCFGGEQRNETYPNPDYKPFLTPRRILQIFGQNQRAIFPDIWASYVFDNIDKYQLETQTGNNQTFYYVITDFRFKNEYEVAKRWQTKKIEGVYKDLIVMKMDRDTVAKSGSLDISEHDLDDFNHWEGVINNNGPLGQLYIQLDDLMSSIKHVYN